MSTNANANYQCRLDACSGGDAALTLCAVESADAICVCLVPCWCIAVLSASACTVFVQDPLGDGNQAAVIALDIRKRKGLKPNPSPLNEYEDKL